MKTFERMLPGETGDIKEIVAGILKAQSRYAEAQHRTLARGTHAKGVCVRGRFEVFDLERTIADPVLRTRLAQGMFAKPGVYPATIRFANAESTFKPDYTPDVRAVSFALSIPPGVLGPDAVRQDFSMNNAPAFPINDAHTFAALMRVKQAGGAWPMIKALGTLSLAEVGGVMATVARGLRQQRNAVRPYQRMRYWSNVPFRHGPDEAIKYSVNSRPGNPAGDMTRSDDMLRDELVRHVTIDDRLSEFDFGIQLLDATHMRHLGRRRDEIFWVENASVEWPEDQAPFHSVGRLTLEHASRLSDEECRNFYIDVTEHSTADSHPLGSINRARWFAESASRRTRLGLGLGTGAVAGADAVPMAAAVDPRALPKARTGTPLPAPAAPRGIGIGRIKVHTLAHVAIALVVAVLFFDIGTTKLAEREMLPVQHVDRLDYADQGLGAGVDSPDRQRLYYTPQGAGFKDVRYRWFTNLELPWGRERLDDPSILARYGFLVDAKTARNPDGLPVGFTRHFDKTLNENLLDLTCATCHTGQLQVTRNGRTSALRIDGGQADHAITSSALGAFVPTVVASMFATVVNPFKFHRFEERVLGNGYPGHWWTLYGEVLSVMGTFARAGFIEKSRHLSPTEEGYGRTDALARIGNAVFGDHLSSKNYVVGDAPVSFPSLWNIWKFDWVQYNASVSQPMARNLGESMGVGAKYALVDGHGDPLPAADRFRASLLIDSLDAIEHTLRKLTPPVWQEDILGAKDPGKAEQGKALFYQHCAGCHGPYIAPDAVKHRDAPGKGPGQPEWMVATLCADDIGTDPNAARNFAAARVDITRTGMTAADLRAVARPTMEKWIARQSAYLESEIARLSAYRDSASALDAVKRELGGLRASSEKQLAGIDPRHLPMGSALSYLGTMIRDMAYNDAHYSAARRDSLDGFGALDQPQIIDAYKSRPLAGVWATPPFLHNGSVPTIYDLLSPPSERPKTFEVGSLEYDPVKLGLAPVKGFQTFDTSLPGNHNTGHEFGSGYDPSKHDRQVRRGLIGPLLTHDEKMAILEYLKVRDDDHDVPPKALIAAMRPSCG